MMYFFFMQGEQPVLKLCYLRNKQDRWLSMERTQQTFFHEFWKVCLTDWLIDFTVWCSVFNDMRWLATTFPDNFGGCPHSIDRLPFCKAIHLFGRAFFHVRIYNVRILKTKIIFTGRQCHCTNFTPLGPKYFSTPAESKIMGWYAEYDIILEPV